MLAEFEKLLMLLSHFADTSVGNQQWSSRNDNNNKITSKNLKIKRKKQHSKNKKNEQQQHLRRPFYYCQCIYNHKHKIYEFPPNNNTVLTDNNNKTEEAYIDMANIHPHIRPHFRRTPICCKVKRMRHFSSNLVYIYTCIRFLNSHLWNKLKAALFNGSDAAAFVVASATTNLAYCFALYSDTHTLACNKFLYFANIGVFDMLY